MRKRRLIAIFIAFLLTIGATAMWSASTIELDGDPDANVIEDSGSSAGLSPLKKNDGNKVARIFSAPFRAFGKLFNRKDDNKIQRMTEKDAERFVSVGVSRVQDGSVSDLRQIQSSGSARERLTSGRMFLKEGRINEAVSELSTAVSLDPKLSEAHNLLGVAFAQKGMQDRAKDSYERAIKAEPQDAQTLNNLGFSLYQSGNYRAAVDRLKRASKLAPYDERILNNLALALCRLGKYEEAYKAFARAGGPLTGNLNMAKMLERFGLEDHAITYYQEARSIDPNCTFALRRLTDLYRRVGKTQESQEAQNALAAIRSESLAAGSK